MHHRITARIGLALISTALCSVSCTTTAATGSASLPFHVAVIPVDVGEWMGEAGIEVGNETQLKLTIDSEPVTRALHDAMGERFCRVSLLPAAPEGATTAESYEFWVAEARKNGADLILDAKVGYETKVHTALNDSFWLNLPLFLIGGPFNWFVNDRSYYVYVQLEANLFNADGAGTIPPPNKATNVQSISTQAEEATLDFVDRGDQVIPYLLTLVAPSGFISSESGAVVPELQKSLANALAADVAQQARSNLRNLINWSGVDFAPVRGVRVTEDRTALVGEFVLRLGDVSRLSFLRYRTDAGEYTDYDLGDGTRVAATGARGEERQRYPFRIPIKGPDVSWIQIQVAQEDDDTTSRTFTFPVPTSGN